MKRIGIDFSIEYLPNGKYQLAFIDNSKQRIVRNFKTIDEALYEIRLLMRLELLDNKIQMQ